MLNLPAKIRRWRGVEWLRVAGKTFWLRRGSHADIIAELTLRAQVGGPEWTTATAVIKEGAEEWLLALAPHARTVLPASETGQAALALARWRLALEGKGLPQTCFWRREGGLVLASPATDVAQPREAIANVLRGALGPTQAAEELLAASLQPLPDIEAQAAALTAVLDAALHSGFPQVVAVPDIEQARAICNLLMARALERGLAVSSDRRLQCNLAMLGPARVGALERPLAQLGGQPAVAVALAGVHECSRRLSHLARVHGLAMPRRAAWLKWLREIGMDGALIVEQFTPVLEHRVEEARRLVLTLLSRSGAQLLPQGASIGPRWLEEWREMNSAPAAAVHPQAAKLARLLRASHAGLAIAAVEANPSLAAAARWMLSSGSATREGKALRLAPGVAAAPSSRSQHAADLRWLAERPQLCPQPDASRAWVSTLLLSAGDLHAWDAQTAKQLRALLDAKEFEVAAHLLEAHALAASRHGAGPPDFETLLVARALGLLLWPPRRLRRMIRMWLRGYAGEWRAALLAILAQCERAIQGPQAAVALVDEALACAQAASGAARAQAWVECANCLGPDDPARARAILKPLVGRTAQGARLFTAARALIALATAEFVSVRIAEALELLRQAREALGRARGFAGRRVLGEIESLTAMYVGVMSGGERSQAALLAPLLELEHQHGGMADLVSRATINDQLFRLRRFETGSFEPREIESLLADARPENRRGYMVLLNQLCENAVYRLDFAAFRRLDARIEALARNGPLDVIIEAAWKRHRALQLALAGRLREALALWRQARAWSAPAPWNRRSSFIRHGEWGFMLMLAGKFKRAGRTFFRATRELRGMDVLGRGAPFCSLGTVAHALAGLAASPTEQAALEELVGGEYLFAQLLARVLQAARGQASWADALAYVTGHDAVASWKGVALTLGAALAMQAAAPEALRWASEARRFLGEHQRALLMWLDTLYPAQPQAPELLRPEVAQALAELRFSLVDPPSVAECCARAAELLAGATHAAVLVRVSVPGARHVAFSGDSARRGELEAFVAALPASGAISGTLAGAPSALAGLVALRLARPATEADLAVVRAFCRRIDECVLLAQALERGQTLRVREQTLGRLAWEFAGAPMGFNARLQKLAQLLAVQCGASGVTLVLARGEKPPEVRAAAISAAVELEAGLKLRVVAAEGEMLALRRGLEQAARLVSDWLRERDMPGFEQEGDEAARLNGEIVGASEASRELARSVRRFADLELSITLVGESGSGKDFCARALHALSRRARGEHVIVDCATLRRETAASELFGHVRGAFTGATSDHVGLLARSHKGTLQLDNVAELSPALQALLLRALEERHITPVGGQRALAFDARILVTSPRSLDALVADKRLRLDFAQRLGGLSLHVPALRERRGDAEILADAFLAQQAAGLGRKLRFGKSAREALRTQTWPGNVRELRSAVARACALCEGEEIRAIDLVPASREAGNPLLSLPREPRLKSCARVLLALARSQGVISPREAAAALGISRTTASLTLTALARADLVERSGAGRATVYRVPR